jgi:hypothetical protein
MLQVFQEAKFSSAHLTPELRRTALRNGGVLHASTQAEPRSGLGLNELLGGTAYARPALCIAQAAERKVTKRDAPSTKVIHQYLMQNMVNSLGGCPVPSMATAHITMLGRMANHAIRRRSFGIGIATVLCRLTPELSRAAARPWASEDHSDLHEAAKRARLERIVRLGPAALRRNHL